MAALKSPLMPSPTTTFPPYSESPTNSPALSNRLSREFRETQSHRSSSGQFDSLVPPPSPYPQQVDPSPVDSNGTERTDIEEAAQEDSTTDSAADELAQTEEDETKSPDIEIISPQSANSDKPSRLDVQLALRSRSDSQEDAPQSVIHVPSGFKDFQNEARASIGVTSPATPEAAISPAQKTPAASPLNTDVAREMDRSTPRAQTRNEVEQEFKRKKRASMLEDIPESGKDAGDDDENNNNNNNDDDNVNVNADEYNETRNEHQDGNDDEDPSTTAGATGIERAHEQSINPEEEIGSLQTALSECWTLCNTLANLSSTHRMRTFQYSGKQEQQEQAWRSCWRLCQKLYESREEDHNSQVILTLELCRDFCQSLFEVRQRGDHVADSVLRVSFELNNHLYNTHDRTLPDAFSERTLDFYVTLCHRLMKQRTSLPQETDALLRACWNLAEILFNLRQSRREGGSADEEQLGSAVQACWDLCDLFREAWSQIRPDRGTPKPTQISFSSHATTSSTRSTERSASSLSDRQYVDASSGPVPETPTTIFDDTTAASSPDDPSTVPNILVLGPATSSGSARGGTHLERWSSNASVMSGYSESASSQRSSSTATAGADETHLNRLRYLLIKAAMNTGWSRSTNQQLPTFAQGMSKNAFGTLPWQMKIFGYYQKLVTNDKSMINAHAFPARRISAAEMAKSVKWLGRNDQWAWMRDLYRIVFGFGIDEAERRGGAIQV